VRFLISSSILVAFALVGVPATAVHANEPVVLKVDGRLYVEIGGYVSVPNGPMTREFDQRLTGWSFQFGMGLSGIPATVGLAAHFTQVATDSWAPASQGPGTTTAVGDSATFTCNARSTCEGLISSFVSSPSGGGFAHFSRCAVDFFRFTAPGVLRPL